MENRKMCFFTSNDSNTKIQMHDSSAKRSKHHGSANHDSTNHNHRSASITVNKNTAYRPCTEKRSDWFYTEAMPAEVKQRTKC